MKRLFVPILATLVAATLIIGCSQPAPAQPTAAPAAKPAEATKAPAAAPTAAPAAQPTAVPAPKLNYPEPGKSITVVVPWAAGSPNDVWIRLAQPYYEKEIGVPLNIIDKPGAAGQVGITVVAKAKPDGYTMGVESLQSTITAYLDPDKQAAFSRKDLQPIAVVAMEPFGLVVPGTSQFKTAKELLDYAKANPEKLKVGTNGLLSPSHEGSALVMKSAGVKPAFVHFNGSSEQVTAMLGGHIDAGGVMAAGLAPQFKSGALRPLGIYDKEPCSSWPGVPTFESMGYKNTVMVRTLGIDFPAGVNPEIVKLWSTAAKTVNDNKEYQNKTAEAGIVTKYMDTVEFTAHWTEAETLVKAVLADIK